MRKPSKARIKACEKLVNQLSARLSVCQMSEFQNVQKALFEAQAELKRFKFEKSDETVCYCGAPSRNGVCSVVNEVNSDDESSIIY